ncbi:hypothetical protein L204_102144 [Cryptococcus depauperatus]
MQKTQPTETSQFQVNLSAASKFVSLTLGKMHDACPCPLIQGTEMDKLKRKQITDDHSSGSMQYFILPTAFFKVQRVSLAPTLLRTARKVSGKPG